MRLLKVIMTSAAFLLAVAVAVGIAQVQENDQLTGKWNMVSTTPDGNDISWTLSITYKDGAYSAAIGGDAGESTAKDLKVEGSKIHMRVPYRDNEYDIDLTLKEGKLVGTWSGNGDSGQTKGEKEAR